MRYTALSVASTALLVLCTTLTASAALPVRGSSGNGEDSNAANWLLLGRSQAVKLSANGKSVMMTREIVCLNQDVEDSFVSFTPALAGSCDSGVYMHLFQLQSTSVNVFVQIGKLVNFVANTGSNPNIGVMLCDPTLNNTVEMCTNANSSSIPNITYTSSKTAVTFSVSNTFPSYPAGTAQEGTGLTFFVITNQAAPLPLQWPTIGIH